MLTFTMQTQPHDVDFFLSFAVARFGESLLMLPLRLLRHTRSFINLHHDFFIFLIPINYPLMAHHYNVIVGHQNIPDCKRRLHFKLLPYNFYDYLFIVLCIISGFVS